MNSLKSKLKLGLVSTVLGMSVAVPVLADDTEIFFGQTSPQNILLALDLSGSMNQDSQQCRDINDTKQVIHDKWYEAWELKPHLNDYVVNTRKRGKKNNRRTQYKYAHDEAITIEECDSKLEVMQQAVEAFLNGLGDANVGIETYPYNTNWGRMRFPVLPLDTVVDVASGKTHREDIIETVKNFSANNSTPIAGALSRAADYFRDKNGTWGTPIQATCGLANTIVLLTDGTPNSTNTTVGNTVNAQIGASLDADGNAIGKCSIESNGKDCSYKLAEALANNDQIGSISNSHVNVSTIAFGLDENDSSDATAIKFMQEVAERGNGSFSNPKDVNTLVDAFISSVDTTVSSSSFVAPSVPLSQSNRLRNGNEVYLAMFQPLPKTTWPGNLKKYYFEGGVIRSEDVTAADKVGAPAVDPDTGLFLDSARSAWNNIADGNFVVDSGAAANIGTKNTFTNLLDNDLSVNQNKLGVSLLSTLDGILGSIIGAIFGSTNELLGNVFGLTRAEANNVLPWFDDRKISVPYKDASKVVNRFGDPLHSKPQIVQYSKTSKIAYLGTNQGYIHAIDTVTGNELWGFIPRQLLDEVAVWKSNSNLGNLNKRPYGMDGDITVYSIDSNKDGDYEDRGDKVYLFVGMRRGGKYYYVLDVTDKNKPQMMFTVLSKHDVDQTKSYVGENIITVDNLGESWSKPIIAKIPGNSGKGKLMMMFGGGYDEYYDDTSAASNPLAGVEGNTIYGIELDPNGDANFSDAKLSFDANVSGFAGLAGKITNSVPADLAAVDLDNNGKIDMVYASDVGGKIYRLDFDATGGTAHKGGVVADMSDQSANRFYNKPDVVFASHDGQFFGVVTIGSGARANPLNTATQDRLYSFFDTTVIAGATPPGLKVGSLLNVTQKHDVNGNDEFYNISDIMAAGKKGWYLDLELGEKVLADVSTINYRSLFTTYIPAAGSKDACSAGAGGNRLYGVNLLDGRPVISSFDRDGDGEVSDVDERYQDLHYVGIAPGITLLFPEDTSVAALVGTETICTGEDCDFGVEGIKTIKWKQDK